MAKAGKKVIKKRRERKARKQRQRSKSPERLI